MFFIFLGGVFIQIVHDPSLVSIKSGDRILAINNIGLLSSSKADAAHAITTSTAAPYTLTVLDVPSSEWLRIQHEIVKNLMTFDEKDYIRPLAIVPDASADGGLPVSTGSIKVSVTYISALFFYLCTYLAAIDFLSYF